MEFVLIPLITWILAGFLKFGFNWLRNGRRALLLIGHGGFPSNHTAIVSSLVWSFILTEQWPLAGLSLAFLMICIFDATGLRREVGRHAASINRLSGSRLREIMGHSPLDIAGGLMVGFLVAWSFQIYLR